MGEMDTSVLRVGGWAGILAGIMLILSLITFFLQIPPPGLEQALTSFLENRTLTIVTTHLFSVALLLVLPFLAALYGSLKEPSRVFARIGLGSGVLAAVITIVAIQGILFALNAFAELYADAAAPDRPVVVAIYGATLSLFQAGSTAGFLFTGLAFVAFGLAMRGSPNFPEGLAWSSVVLGILIVLFTFLVLTPLAIIAVVVLVLGGGWKVYGLSKSA